MDTASCAIYASDDAGLEIVVRKNTIEDPADGRTEEVADKAEVCNRMSAHLFRILESRGLHTAFREEVTDTESLFRKAELIPILVTVHNYSAGSYPARTGLPEGTALASPSMDFHYLNRALGNPMINGYDALAMKLVSESAVETIVKTAFRVNEVLSAYFRDLKMDLIDIEIRFGRIKEELVLKPALRAVRQQGDAVHLLPGQEIPHLEAAMDRPRGDGEGAWAPDHRRADRGAEGPRG